MSGPSAAWRATLAQLGMELRLTARRSENVLVVAVIPAVVLVFFATIDVVATPTGAPVDFLLPGVLALGLIAAGVANLGIATAYERHHGVLKRLGASPLPRSGLVVAKLGAVVVVELIQVGALVAIAVAALGWAPGPDASLALLGVAVVLGTGAFAGLGLLLAGTLRAEATLAIANGLFLGFLLLGGIVLPIDHLPDALEALAGLLPAAALADLFRVALDSGADVEVGRPLAVLSVWAIGVTALTVRGFRWE